jgi:protein TonB
VSVGQSGTAAAPAPAKESTKPLAPVFQEKPGLLPQSGKGNPETADNLFEPAAKSPPVAAPTFAALDSGESSESTGGSKTGIIVAVAILLLAAAGYFGYTKLLGKKQAAPAAAPQSQPSPDGVPVSSNNPPVVPQASVQTPAAPSTHSEPVGPQHAAATKEESADPETEVVVTHPATEKILAVKSDVTKTAPKPAQQVASAEISAPPVIGAGGSAEPTAISSIVQSAPVALPNVATPQTLRVSQGVTEGLLLKKVPPVYPRQAIQMHVQGAVQMQAMIDKQGRISSVKVLKGDPMLARAAVEAVNQWRYKPYFLDGQPVDIQTQITVNFKLP